METKPLLFFTRTQTRFVRPFQKKQWLLCSSPSQVGQGGAVCTPPLCDIYPMSFRATKSTEKTSIMTLMASRRDRKASSSDWAHVTLQRLLLLRTCVFHHRTVTTAFRARRLRRVAPLFPSSRTLLRAAFRRHLNATWSVHSTADTSNVFECCVLTLCLRSRGQTAVRRTVWLLILKSVSTIC